MKYKILKFIYKLLKKTPADMPMVSYWKRQDSVQAKIMRMESGNIEMQLEGEKYRVVSFPRGYLLFGGLSKLKHEIKNKIFNDSWWALEANVPEEEVIKEAKDKLFKEIATYLEPLKYDLLPETGYCPAVREIYRAFTEVGDCLPPGKDEKVYLIRDILCLIIQEDDGYRFRVQDLAEWMNPNSLFQVIYRFFTGKSYLESLKSQLKYGLEMIEHCEVLGDMKERIRLLRRILLMALNDNEIGELYSQLAKKISWMFEHPAKPKLKQEFSLKRMVEETEKLL